MGEIKRKVVPIEVNYVCDKCEHGMMGKIDEVDAEGKVLHECRICAHQQSFKWQSYPRIEYIGVDEITPE
jgi:hypothetical protein